MEKENAFPLSKKSYIGIIFSVLLIVSGYLLMMGGASIDGTFNPAVFNFQRITLAPLLVLSGMTGVLIALRLKSKTPVAS